MSKRRKLPAPFTRAIAQADFEKKIIKRIHVKGEESFARSLYVPNPENDQQLLFAAELDKAGIKRIKTLAKAIKRNRGFVSWGKLIILAVLIGGFGLFNLVFKNHIMTGLLESSLQGIFSARVEAGGVDFDPLGGKIRLGSLAVADKDHPMRNLFELGETGLNFDLWQAVNGRVWVTLIECQNIRFNSARTYSGALPGRSTIAKKPATAATGQAANPMAGFANLNQLDPASLIGGQLDKLESLKMAAELNTEFGALTDQATSASAAVQSKVKNLAAASATRIVGNLSAVRNKGDLDAALAKSADFKTEIASVQKEADATGKQLQDQLISYQKRLKDIEAAARRDQANLSKTITQPQAAGTELAASAAQQIMGPRSRELLAMAQKIPELLAALGQGKEKAPAAPARSGRVVNFPVAQHPLLQIDKIVGSVLMENQLELALQVALISSDQTITGEPTTFQVHFGDPQLAFDLNGTVDLRSGQTDVLVMDGALRGLAVQLGPELSFAGLRSLEGQADIKGNYHLDHSNNAQVIADLALRGIKTEQTEGSLLGRVSQAAINSLGDRVTGQLTMGMSATGEFTFAMTSGLDAALAAGMQSAIKAELAKMQTELGAELDKQLAKTLGDDKAKNLKQLIADNGADVKNLKDLQQKVDSQTAELQKLGKTFGAVPDVKKTLGGIKLPGF